jgi:hypothetical protein
MPTRYFLLITGAFKALGILFGSRPHTVAKAETKGYARAFRRAFDWQQRCRLR